MAWKNRAELGCETSWVPWQVQHFGAAACSSECRLSSYSAWVAVWHLPHTSTTVLDVGGLASCEPWHEAQLGARMSLFSSRATPWTLSE